MKDERAEKLKNYFLTHQLVIYVYQCSKCDHVESYPPEHGVKFCRCCGYKLPDTLPVYDRYTEK